MENYTTSSLKLPTRSEKPRQSGRTHILEKGYSLRQIEDLLSVSGHFIDFCKLGWGTSVVTKDLDKKIELYEKNDVEVTFGGTLFEVFYAQNKLDDYKAMLRNYGMKSLEISDGTLEIPLEKKLDIISDFAKDFVVYSEVGSKDTETVVMPAKWVKSIQQELESGSAFVILEGRESGTAGMYRGTGEIRKGLIEEIIDSGIDPNKLIFETPNKASQVWVIKNQGPNVNLANIAPDDVIPLETLRLGLRSDTLTHFHQ